MGIAYLYTQRSESTYAKTVTMSIPEAYIHISMSPSQTCSLWCGAPKWAPPTQTHDEFRQTWIFYSAIILLKSRCRLRYRGMTFIINVMCMECVRRSKWQKKFSLENDKVDGHCLRPNICSVWRYKCVDVDRVCGYMRESMLRVTRTKRPLSR